jgi:hypothetical protein
MREDARLTPRRALVRVGMLSGFSGAILAAHALGGDDGIPQTELAIGGENLRGKAWSVEEGHATGPNECAGMHGDGIPTIRRHVSVARGRHEATLLLRRSDRPAEVEVTVYRHLDRFSTPTGKWKEKATSLAAVESRGRTTGWIATFQLKVDGRRYVDAFAEWPDEDGCGEDSASFVFPGIRPE